MQISAKARYGLSAMICIAKNYDSKESMTIISIAENLKISKIYLEQVFSLLKRANLVLSSKGPHGGYQLSRMPKEISVFDVLYAIETSIFEKTDTTVSESAKEIETAMQNLVFSELDKSINSTLSLVSLEDLLREVKKLSPDEPYMYYL